MERILLRMKASYDHYGLKIYLYTLSQLYNEFQVFFSTHYVLVVRRHEFKFTGANRGEIAVAPDWLPVLKEGIRKGSCLDESRSF